jgi:hypothetical protein
VAGHGNNDGWSRHPPSFSDQEASPLRAWLRRDLMGGRIIRIGIGGRVKAVSPWLHRTS